MSVNGDACNRLSTKSTVMVTDLQALTEAELQGQTAKFRAIIHERTDEIERRIAELKDLKRVAKDPAERETIDELGGADGRGGLEGQLREVIRDTLDEILPEAFATVREAARRLMGTTVSVTGRDLIWDMVHYDVQLIGGIELHLGRIAEMATGEGKTLVAHCHSTSMRSREGRAPRDGELVLPAATRSGWGTSTSTSADGRLPGRHPARHGRAAWRLRERHHLRHQQRVRLRLPARQHGDRAGPPGATTALVCDRRRSGLGPHRRGADAADHLRPRRQRK